VKIRHFFIPHPQTHKKAHLITYPGLLGFIILFLLVQIFLNYFPTVKPGVLGVSADINVEEVIRLTNIERQKNGLPTLTEDLKLDDAARRKAANMFEENYWAHYSPSGKDPWSFINAAGYKFSYAGENLARNFSSSNDVVQAWMNSPSHKENLLNTHYQNVGIAVVPGTLLGQETTLVVQEFGRPSTYVASAPETPQQEAPQKLAQNPIASTDPQVLPTLQPVNKIKTDVAGQQQQFQVKPAVLVNPLQVTKAFGFMVIGLVLLLTLIDVYIIKKRGVIRLSTRHLPQISLMVVAGVVLFNLVAGSVL
jgi:hypothetical protein